MRNRFVRQVNSIVAFVILIGLFGALIGSFVNVVAIRVPAGESLGGRSHCATCNATLDGMDLLPIVSWVALRGHCRHCGASVSGSYTVGEGVCCALFVVLAARFGLHAVLVPYLLLAAGLLSLSIVDLRVYRLPDRIVAPLTVVVVAAFGIAAFVDGTSTNFTRALECGLAATAVLGLLHLAYPRGLGFGDVKLAFVLGFASGWVSWSAVGLSLFLAAMLGSVVGVAGAWIAGEPVRGRQLPFGPFLAGGALLAVVVGPSLLDWYSGLLR